MLTSWKEVQPIPATVVDKLVESVKPLTQCARCLSRKTCVQTALNISVCCAMGTHTQSVSQRESVQVNANKTGPIGYHASSLVFLVLELHMPDHFSTQTTSGMPLRLLQVVPRLCRQVSY